MIFAKFQLTFCIQSHSLLIEAVYFQTLLVHLIPVMDHCNGLQKPGILSDQLNAIIYEQKLKIISELYVFEIIGVESIVEFSRF